MTQLFNMKLTEVSELALEYKKAKYAYHMAFVRYSASIKPLEMDRFWEILENYYRPELLSRLNGRSSSEAVKDTAHELFRVVVVEENPRIISYGSKPSKFPYTFDEMMRFAIMYHSVAHQLSKPLWDTVERGDDGFDDLLDSLVIAGKEVHDRAAAGGFHKEHTLNKAVGEAVAKMLEDNFDKIEDDWHKRLTTWILYGENYNHMALTDNAEKWFASHVVDQLSEEEYYTTFPVN